MFGNLLTGLEAIAFAATIESAAEKAAFQKSIHDLIAKHQKELDVISSIYELCEKLFFDEGLLNQLKIAQLHSVKQWEIIGRSMNNQIGLVNDFMKQFKDIQPKASDSTIDWLNYFIIGIYSLGFIDKGWKLYQGIKNPPVQETPQLEPELTEGSRRASIDSFHSCVSELETADSTVERVRNSSSASNVINELAETTAVRQGLNRSKFETMTDWGKTGLKFAAEHGVRILFLTFSIINFVRGRIDINNLRDTFKKTQEFFGDKGGFKQKEDNVAIALLTISANVFSLANVSYSVVSELHSVYLTRSAIEPVNANSYFLKAAQMVPQKFGLTPTFLASCEQFLDQVKVICKTVKNVSERLDQLEQTFRPFIQQGTVSQVFQNVIVLISRSVASDAVLSQELHQKQQNFTALLKATKDTFLKKRGANFEQQPLNVKKQIDYSILSDVEIIYKELIIEDPGSALNSRDQLTIAEVISNFCTSFYGTDDSGQNVYKYNIADSRSKQKYSDLLNDVSLTNPQGRVPIRLSNPAAEEQEREKMAALALQVNSQQQVIPGNFSITSKDILFRYTRVTVQDNGKKNEKGEALSSAVGSEGAQFSYQGASYEVEQELLSKRSILAKL